MDDSHHRLLAVDGNALEDGLLGDCALVVDDTFEDIHSTCRIIVLVLIEWGLLCVRLIGPGAFGCTLTHLHADRVGRDEVKALNETLYLLTVGIGLQA